MRELFLYIKKRLNKNVPEIKTVRIWNEQVKYSEGGVFLNDKLNKRYKAEKAFRLPAIFIEFNQLETHNRSHGVRDILLQVIFRFAIEGYKLERLETFDQADKVIEALQLMAPTPESGLIFTTFQEESTIFDYEHNNVEEPVIIYRTFYRSLAGYKLKNMTTNQSPISPTIQTDIVTQL